MSKRRSTLVVTYRTGMAEPRVLAHVQTPRRWRTRVFYDGPHGSAEDVITTDRPTRLTDVLTTALASLADVLVGVTDIYDAGFDVEMLR